MRENHSRITWLTSRKNICLGIALPRPREHNYHWLHIARNRQKCFHWQLRRQNLPCKVDQQVVITKITVQSTHSIKKYPRVNEAGYSVGTDKAAGVNAPERFLPKSWPYGLTIICTLSHSFRPEMREDTGT